MSQDGASTPDAPATARIVLFVTSQFLLAETVGRVVARDGDWSIKVLSRDHPHLLHHAIAAEPAVVVVDVDNEVLPGLELISQLVAALPGAGVLALGELDGVTTFEAMYRGAQGVLTYAASLDDVRQALAAAAAGRTAVGPAALTGLLGVRPKLASASAEAPAHQLSPREQEILRAVVAGRSTAAIAADLGISVQTVRKHTQNMLAKLGVHSKLEAAAVATRKGFM